MAFRPNPHHECKSNTLHNNSRVVLRVYLCWACQQIRTSNFTAVDGLCECSLRSPPTNRKSTFSQTQKCERPQVNAFCALHSEYIWIQNREGIIRLQRPESNGLDYKFRVILRESHNTISPGARDFECNLPACNQICLSPPLFAPPAFCDSE